LYHVFSNEELLLRKANCPYFTSVRLHSKIPWGNKKEESEKNNVIIPSAP